MWPGPPEEFEVTGLEPNTTYYFAIKAADEIPNWSGISNVAIQTTAPEDTPPAAIADVGLDNPSETSLRVTWTAPGDDGTTGTAATYDMRYSTSVLNDANWDAPRLSPASRRRRSPDRPRRSRSPA